MAILLIICYVLIFSCLSLRRTVSDWRLKFIKSTLIFGAILTFSTLFINYFFSLNFVSLVIFWVVMNLVLLSYFLIHYSKIEIPKFTIKGISFNDKLLLSAIFIVCVVTFFIALLVFPNNWDSMVYHLARIPNWIQNQSIDFYTTHSLSSVYQNPFAEYVILHLVILSKGNYYLANLVQWFAFVNSIIGISYLVKVLGGRLQAQIFAAFLLATLPMAILQSNTTQNDLVAAMYLIFTAIFIYAVQANFYSYKAHIFLGLSVGLAIFSKGTSFIYLLPFAVFYAFLFFKHFNLKAIQLSCIVAVLILKINFNHWNNNYQCFKKPLSPNYGYLIKDNFGKCFACNALKNATLQLQFPFDKVRPFNKASTKIISKFDLERENCKWDASPNLDFVMFRFNEDYMANPFHFTLFLLSIFIYFFFSKKSKRKTTFVLSILAIAFTFNFILTWQVWHPRLHLPILGLACGFTALIIQHKRLKHLIAIGMLSFAALVVLQNELKPMLKNNVFKLDEKDQLFIFRKELKPVFEEIIPLIEPYQTIGLINTGASWEFPFWYFLNRDFNKEIRSILVDNKTNQYAKKDFIPKVIISQKSVHLSQLTLLYKNEKYLQKYSKNDVSIYLVK